MEAKLFWAVSVVNPRFPRRLLASASCYTQLNFGVSIPSEIYPHKPGGGDEQLKIAGQRLK